MKKTYKLENLCCANCAAKMEHRINKIKGVENASINFMFQRLDIEADDSHFEEIIDEAAAICKKIEPGCILKK